MLKWLINFFRKPTVPIDNWDIDADTEEIEDIEFQMSCEWFDHIYEPLEETKTIFGVWQFCKRCGDHKYNRTYTKVNITSDTVLPWSPPGHYLFEQTTCTHPETILFNSEEDDRRLIKCIWCGYEVKFIEVSLK